MKRLSIREAKNIMGSLMLDIDAIEMAFGFIPEQIPHIPYSAKELEKCAELKLRLYLEVPCTDKGLPLSIENMAKIVCCGGKNIVEKSEYLLFNDEFDDNGNLKSNTFLRYERYKEIVENRFTKFGWRIASEEAIRKTVPNIRDTCNDVGLNYITQTDILINEHEKVFKNFSNKYEKSIVQWREEKPKILEVLYRKMHDGELKGSKYYDYNEELYKNICREMAKLKIVHVVRESVTSAFYRYLLIYKKECRMIFYMERVCSNDYYSDGGVVTFGEVRSSGAKITGSRPNSCAPGSVFTHIEE